MLCTGPFMQWYVMHFCYEVVYECGRVLNSL